MATPKRRENTFRIDFGHIPKKPTAKDIHLFVGKRLGLTQQQVKRIQYSQHIGCAFITCFDLDTAKRIVQQHRDQHEITVGNQKYILRIRMEESGTEVRIYDLSDHITDKQIIAHMSKYGEVHSIKELLWDDRFLFPGMPSGIRLLRMTLKEHIDSYITIHGEHTAVSYSGQRQTCRHCGELIHIGIPCTQNKKLLVQKMSVNGRLNQTASYAGVLKKTALSYNTTGRTTTNNTNLDTNTSQAIPDDSLSAMDLDAEFTQAGTVDAADVAAAAPNAVTTAAASATGSADAVDLTTTEDQLSNTNTTFEVSGTAAITNIGTLLAPQVTTVQNQLGVLVSRANDGLFKVPISSLRSEQAREKAKRNNSDDANSSDSSVASTSRDSTRVHRSKKPKALTDTSKHPSNTQ